jgi:putative drug exporter of the RND superfamily
MTDQQVRVVAGRGGARDPKGAGGVLERFLHRMALAITGRPRMVVALWLVAIVAAIPFALQMDSVLTKQGASKVVPGTESAEVDRLVESEFPQRSQHESFVVVTAPDVRSAEVKTVLADLDAALAPSVKEGTIVQTASAFTIFRDAAAGYLTALQARLGSSPPSAVEDLITAGEVPEPLANAARASIAKQPIAEVAGRVALAADWSAFPVALPGGTLDKVIGPSGNVALVSVSYAPGQGDPDIAGLRQSALDAAKGTEGVGVHVTGELALIADTYTKVEADSALMETVAYGIIMLVLLIFFRAVVPAVITLVLIGLTMFVAQAALFGLGHTVTLTQFTVTIMTFVMLGAGVDYSMLLSSRYRQERLAGRPVHQAVVHATTHAGESVVLAGLAVVLAFGATLASPVDWIPPLGFGGLIGIPIILLAALTLTPALLMILGDRFFLLGRNAMGDMENTGLLNSYLRKLSTVAARRRVTVTLVFLVATVPLGLIVASSSPTGDPVALSPDTDAKAGFATVASEFGQDSLFPTLVAGPVYPDLRAEDGLTPQGLADVADLSDQLAALPGVTGVDSLTRPFGAPAPNTTLPLEVRQDYLSDDGTLRIVVRLAGDPHSEEASRTLERIDDVVAITPVGDLRVGGTTRVDEDYRSGLMTSFWLMVTLVCIGVFIALLLTLRSVVIPVQLIGTIVMGNVCALGLTVLIFDCLRGEVVVDDLPIFLTILMMGLGMDYEIFLVTRVRDLVRGGMDTAGATLRAVADTGRVITGAGLVMVGSLGTMVLSSTLALQQYGTGLATAVLLDATIIRMMFVPATLLLVGKYNWWMPGLRRPRMEASTA